MDTDNQMRGLNPSGVDLGDKDPTPALTTATTLTTSSVWTPVPAPPTKLDINAVQTWVNLGVNRDGTARNIPVRYLHPVTPSQHGSFGSHTRDVRTGARMSLSRPGYTQQSVRAAETRSLRAYNGPSYAGSQSHLVDTTAIPLPDNVPQASQRIPAPARPTTADLSSFEAFMEEIERSSPTHSSETTTVPTSHPTPANATHLVPYTDPMRHSSINPPTHGAQRAVLRRDTTLEHGNVVSPTCLVALPFGDVIEVAHPEAFRAETEEHNYLRNFRCS